MKKQLVWSFIGTSAVMIAALVLVLVACSKQDESTPTQPDYAVSLKSDPVMVTFDLIANQNQLAGTITFTETASGLLVNYNTTGGWQLGAVHFWIGTTDQPDYSKPYNSGYPSSNGGPIPGQFPYKFENLGWVTSYSFTIPKAALGGFCEAAYYVLCHANLRILNGGVYQTATGWSEGEPTPGSNWAMISFFDVVHVLLITDPEGVCEPETVDLTAAEITAGSTEGFTFTYWLDEEFTQELTNPEAVAESGTYYIKGTSPMGCVEVGSVEVTIYPAPEFTVTYPDPQDPGTEFDLSSVVTDESNVETWEYYDDQGLLLEGSLIILPTEPGDYYYWIKGISEHGCELMVSVKITITGEPGPPDILECETWGNNETAFGGNSAGGGGSWWYYFNISNGNPQTIYAGQTFEAGTVEYNDGVITITFENDWDLQVVSENVKIGGYNTPPTSKPTPGHLPWKYTITPPVAGSLTFDVSEFPVYVIHLDVRQCTEWQ